MVTNAYSMPLGQLAEWPETSSQIAVRGAAGVSLHLEHTLNQLFSSNEIAEPARKTPVYGEFDVVVLGGGPAGIAAAASAAAYSGSKAYVLNFTQSLQMEYAGSAIRIQLVMPGPIRTEFFSSQGLSESIFPPESYLTPEQLVDGALAGLDAGESVTVPSMPDEQVWIALEAARTEFVKATMSGKVAVRYRS